jgi:LacI family transcriptional regulator, galactose operon repressor
MSNQITTVNGSGLVSGDISRGGGRPTMKDVATRAGVALKTVSRVVNREPGVTPETTQRVLGAIEDLGFRRNESARLLRTGHTATLGYIADSWTDPDHAAVYRGLENVAREHGYLLYSGSADRDPGREERLALAMCARRVDGLVISPSQGAQDYLVPEIEAGVATVFVLRPPEIGCAGAGSRNTGLLDTGCLDIVLPDERAGARLAIAHLARLGHRKIGFLAEPAGTRSGALRSGYADAMAAAGLAADPAWLTLDAAALAGTGVTAVFCASQERTRSALRALGPRGVTVVGFGDFEFADLITPPVTVVSYDPVLIGSTAGELLLRRLAGEQGPPRRVRVPVKLVAR